MSRNESRSLDAIIVSIDDHALPDSVGCDADIPKSPNVDNAESPLEHHANSNVGPDDKPKFFGCRTCGAPLWTCAHGSLSRLQSTAPQTLPVPPFDEHNSSFPSSLPVSPRTTTGPAARCSHFWPEIISHSIKRPGNAEFHARPGPACTFCSANLDIFAVPPASSSPETEPAVLLHCGHVLGANCMMASAALGSPQCPLCLFDTTCPGCRSPVSIPLPTAAEGPRALPLTLAQRESLGDGAHPSAPALCPRCDEEAQYATALRGGRFPSPFAHRLLATPLFRLVNRAVRAHGVVSGSDAAGARAVACDVAELVEDNFRALLQASRVWDVVCRAEHDPWAAVLPTRDAGRRFYAGLRSEDTSSAFLDPQCEASRAEQRAKMAAADAQAAERFRAAFENDLRARRAAWLEAQQRGITIASG
ncbi:hypothetical protein HYQ45_007015 [Verticillium longisporum]|uniref:RING-type domain-containing protein n=1 Tax=Verticillium longisporum TaxID=100787 RepID=A0A8I2ZQ48_VERLO|nr:hypothetical protein HYQ45_007015 [Verticillium longisporum]